jgi:hypothetical protein
MSRTITNGKFSPAKTAEESFALSKVYKKEVSKSKSTNLT